RNNGLKLKTPSGRIEFKSSLLEAAGFPSFPEYEPVPPPPEGKFRLTVGRGAVHTHVSTQNNLYLGEITSENLLWINDGAAAKLGVADGALVEVTSPQGQGRVRAKVTGLIHPEAVFLLHGFGHRNPLAGRSFGRGLSDSLLQENATDEVGGSPALHHTFVTVKPA
ncbi:MAG: molybdopterin dinucleotide binding domain-containing protein, partial [Thermodesulfobacteriota bacterium]